MENQNAYAPKGLSPLIDGASIDREIANESICPECGGSMHYRSLRSEAEGYRAFAVCDNSACDTEIEF